MPTQAKRHYRVAKRTIDTPDHSTSEILEAIDQLTMLGVVMLMVSTLASFLLGYCIGRTE